MIIETKMYLKASTGLKMISPKFMDPFGLPLVSDRLRDVRTRVWPNRKAAAANSFASDGFT